MTKKTTFKDFTKNLKESADTVKPGAPFLEPDESVDNHKVPVLFCSIHNQSEDRPDGYTPDDIFDMNLLGNSHIPELQKKMLEDHESNGHDISRHKELYENLKKHK